MGRDTRANAMDLRKEFDVPVTYLHPMLRPLAQVGHDNWVRDIVFHPAGKHMITAADDSTYRIWDLKTGRCVRVVEAHERFVSCIAWGRQTVSAESNGNTTEGSPATRLINVIATGGSDQVSIFDLLTEFLLSCSFFLQTVKIWLP